MDCASSGSTQGADNELLRVHTDGAGYEVDGQPKTSKEASEEDCFAAIAVKMVVDSQKAMARQPATKPRVSQNVRAPSPPANKPKNMKI